MLLIYFSVIADSPVVYLQHFCFDFNFVPVQAFIQLLSKICNHTGFGPHPEIGNIHDVFTRCINFLVETFIQVGFIEGQ